MTVTIKKPHTGLSIVVAVFFFLGIFFVGAAALGTEIVLQRTARVCVEMHKACECPHKEVAP